MLTSNTVLLYNVKSNIMLLKVEYPVTQKIRLFRGYSRLKHKYIFYFYPKYGEKKGKFRFFNRSSDGKLWGEMNQRNFDYSKIY